MEQASSPNPLPRRLDAARQAHHLLDVCANRHGLQFFSVDLRFEQAASPIEYRLRLFCVFALLRIHAESVDQHLD